MLDRREGRLEKAHGCGDNKAGTKRADSDSSDRGEHQETGLPRVNVLRLGVETFLREFCNPPYCRVGGEMGIRTPVTFRVITLSRRAP